MGGGVALHCCTNFGECLKKEKKKKIVHSAYSFVRRRSEVGGGMDLEENAVTPPMRLISGGGGKDGPLRVFVLRESACALVYGWDAVWIADTFFSERKVLKSVECGNSSDSMDVDVEGIQLINVNHAKLLPVLRCALGESKRQVEIYSRGIDCWSLTKKLFPGNEDSIEEILSQTNLLADSMLTLAINFHSNNFVTAAFIDTNSKKISILQYSDNDQLSDTESLIVSIDPKECILRSGSETDSTVLKLQSVLQMCSIPFTFTSKVSWKAQDVEQDLKRLLTKDLDQSLLDILELKGCLECVSAVIKHLELLSHDDNFGGFSLEKFTLSSYMKLDFAAIKALNLFPSSSDSSVQSSLFGLLNHCQTAMGSRSLMRRLKQPILDKNVIEKRLDLLECFYLDSELRQSLHEQHLKRIPDLDRLLKKLSSRKASLKDVVHLYTFVIRLPILIEALETFSNEALLNLIHETFISPLKACQQDLSAFESLIEQTVDLQATMKHEYIIRADFCPELAALSRAKEKISNIIDAIRVKVASELNLEESKLKLNHNGTHGYFLRVTRKDETALRGRPKFICLETRKDGVKFTTKEIRQHSSELNDYSKEYNLLQTAVVDKIIDVTRKFHLCYI